MSNAPFTTAIGFDLSESEVVKNPSVDSLIQDALEFDGDLLASNGAIVALSGKYTGRSPKDKFTVRTHKVDGDIWWENNNAMSPEVFDRLHMKAQELLPGKRLYIIDTYAGADPQFRIAVRFIVERPYHALFIKQLLIRPSESELANFRPDWTVVDLGRYPTDPEKDNVRGDATVAMNYDRQEVIIFGTEYAGEMKKSVFTLMNFLLPKQGVLSMHCSANIGASGDTALFFGLSGTGKTTLSADPERNLIGDDEHGWSDHGVFNIEGGCYAKCIKLSHAGEPEIWDAIRHGAVLENVVLGPDGTPDYDDGSLTENTRCAYPLEHIPNRAIPSIGGHPKNIVFLTFDALGVLPPISRLSSSQAMEMFLNGYTAKVAGTEQGITEPTINFSTCFGQPFLPLHPQDYAKLLGEKIERHQARVWLVNTGWTGGPYGIGSRIKLSYTRAFLHAAFSGVLDTVNYTEDAVFGFQVPESCPDVPTEILSPRNTWQDKAAYDEKAHYLKSLFEQNLVKIRG
jgi:phosphoenolpyruvate carboxykinase (ATP)